MCLDKLPWGRFPARLRGYQGWGGCLVWFGSGKIWKLVSCREQEHLTAAFSFGWVANRDGSSSFQLWAAVQGGLSMCRPLTCWLSPATEQERKKHFQIGCSGFSYLCLLKTLNEWSQFLKNLLDVLGKEPAYWRNTLFSSPPRGSVFQRVAAVSAVRAACWAHALALMALCCGQAFWSKGCGCKVASNKVLGALVISRSVSLRSWIHLSGLQEPGGCLAPVGGTVSKPFALVSDSNWHCTYLGWNRGFQVTTVPKHKRGLRQASFSWCWVWFWV